MIHQAKDRGWAVTCEVTPHHLLLTDEAVSGYDTACKVNPPLREAQDVQALRAALADGTIDSIVTDHAPHSALEKDCEFSAASPGMMGLELCFALLLRLLGESPLTLSRLIDAFSTRPAQLIGIEPPSLREGRRAELVLVDPAARWRPMNVQLRSKSRNTPFLEETLTGRVLLTMADGRLIHELLGSQ
jgi:dihydroorotase